jgi:hypothetical protein
VHVEGGDMEAAAAQQIIKRRQDAELAAAQAANQALPLALNTVLGPFMGGPSGELRLLETASLIAGDQQNVAPGSHHGS